MQSAIVNVNGEITKGQDAKVSVFDRGFLYGDSLYEVIRTYHGHFAFLNEHLERLQKSAELARMIIAQSPEFLKTEMERTLKAFQELQNTQGKLPSSKPEEAYCRLIITRGIGNIGFGLSALLSPSQYFIIVQPLEPPTEKQLREGLRLRIVKRLRNDPRALDPAMKSGNYLNNLLAYLEANAEGYDDALLCNADGHLTEGTTFNIFYVKATVLATPPLDIGILDGITRRQVIQIARDLELPVREVRFPRECLLEADEVFLTSSIKEVFPVTDIDGQSIGNGKPGPLTLKLRTAFETKIRQTTRIP